MASSSASSPSNWAELPPELTALIFNRLGAVEILENAQKVCMPWCRVSKDPSLWRKIDMRTRVDDVESLCRQAVDRSNGGLVEINIGRRCTDSLLSYIADRSSNLRCLRLQMYYPITDHGLLFLGLPDNGLVNSVAKLPLLEELEVSMPYSSLNLKAIGHACKKLKTLKLNCSFYTHPRLFCNDVDALGIAESMPELCHLQLLGNRLTDTGLNAILDNCPHLEHLDIRQCLNINLSGDLEKRCLERIKDLRRPHDSTVDYPFYVVFNDTDFSDTDDDFYRD